MGRRTPGKPTKNEVQILRQIASSTTSIHEYELNQDLAENGIRISYTTVYRCLAQLEDRALAVSKWDLGDPKAKPRRNYQVTEDGLRHLSQINTEATTGVSLRLG